MNRNKMKLTLISLLALSGIVSAREMFTPLTLRKDYKWYPFLDDCCGEERDEEKCVEWKFMMAPFNRTATKATGNDNYNTADDGTKNCDNDEIAKLFFAKSPFYLQDAFANGQVGRISNPLVNFAKINPHVTFEEKGLMFGFDVSAPFFNCNKWRWGLRGSVPFAHRTVNQLTCCADLIDNSKLDDVVQTGVREPVGGNTIQNSFAMRLDVLSALYNNGLNGVRFVEYGDAGTSTKMASQDVALDQTVGTNQSINMVVSSTGTLPSKPFSATAATVGATTALDAEGDNVASGRTRFTTGVDYASGLALDGTQQAQLFVVPTLNAAGNGISGRASTIQTTANALLHSFDEDVQDFLATANGGPITFDPQQVQGAGDLELELFLNYQWLCCLWFEGRVGLALPTGVETDEPGKVFKLPIGNNGHVGVDLGLAMGWDFARWLKLYGDVKYRWTLSATETIAGAFTGATVKNIGPKQDAKISWGHFLAHIDATIIPTCVCNWIGFDLGYEFYWKKKDDVNFCNNSAADLSGVTQTLNSCVLERMTKVVSHKLSVESFTTNECYNLYAGFSSVVGGKNVMKEAEWHLGMTIKF